MHLLLAGMAVAATRGLGDTGSLELAERLDTANHDDFDQLPTSCTESADVLEAQREMFEADGVFPGLLIDAVVAGLRETDGADAAAAADADADDDGTQRGERASDDDAREELIRRHRHVG